jgi:hypothetical protein
MAIKYTKYLNIFQMAILNIPILSISRLTKIYPHRNFRFKIHHLVTLVTGPMLWNSGPVFAHVRMYELVDPFENWLNWLIRLKNRIILAQRKLWSAHLEVKRTKIQFWKFCRISLLATRGRCYDHNFQRFLPIFCEKNGGFLKNQCYDQIFAKN